MKKLLSLTITLILLITCLSSFTVFAEEEIISHDTILDKAFVLSDIGLFQGTENGFELEKPLTRAEGTVMIVRVTGKQNEVLQGSYEHPFTDVPEWANKYIGYLYTEGKVNGVSETEFGPSQPMTAEQFTTMVLRVLGYDDSNGDFTWDKSLEKALEVGLLNEEEKTIIESKDFNRGFSVNIIYNAMLSNLKDEETKLVENWASSSEDFKLTRIFYILIDESECNELMREDRKYNDLFSNDEEAKSNFISKVKKVFKPILDFYTVEYNNVKYKVELKEAWYSSELLPVNRQSISFTCDVINLETGEKTPSITYVAFQVDKMYLRPWSDSGLRESLAQAIAVADNFSKGDYDESVLTEDTYITSESVNDDSFDSNLIIDIKGKTVGKYLVPFDKGASLVKLLDK